MIGISQHETFVAEWEAAACTTLQNPDIRDLFQRGFDAVWMRAVVTLGQKTLEAIAERVRWGCLVQYPWMADIRLNKRGYELAALDGATLSESTLRLGLRTLLASFLDLIAALTANVLSQQLRTELLLVKVRTHTP